MDDIHSEDYLGYTISLWVDEDCESPRQDEPFGELIMMGGLGDKNLTRDEMVEYERLYSKDIRLPVYRMEHSGTWLNTEDFHDRWDSGLTGWIRISKANARKELGTTDTQLIEQRLHTEVVYYGKWLNGECYGYTIEKNDKQIHGSGFIGYDEVLAAAHSAVDNLKTL